MNDPLQRCKLQCARSVSAELGLIECQVMTEYV